MRIREPGSDTKRKVFDLITARFGTDLSGHTIALWGLSFKPNTDDMREAPSITLIEAILAAGGKIKAYDPKAMAACERILGKNPNIEYSATVSYTHLRDHET